MVRFTSIKTYNVVGDIGYCFIVAIMQRREFRIVDSTKLSSWLREWLQGQLSCVEDTNDIKDVIRINSYYSTKLVEYKVASEVTEDVIQCLKLWREK